VNARHVAFRADFSAPTHAAISTPFAQVGPAIARLGRELLQGQRADGSWRELAAGNSASVADVLALFAFLGRDDPRRAGLKRTLLMRQLPDGGWANSASASSELDATVRSYLALKLNGPEADTALDRARERLAAWGSGPCDSQTRLLLALFGQVPHDDWMALPANSPLEKWSLQIVNAYRPVRLTSIDPVLAHLFRDEFRRSGGGSWNPLGRWNARHVGQCLVQYLANPDSWAGDAPTSILPLIALRCLGHDESSVAVRAAWRILDERIIDDDVAAVLSPLRDSALALSALREAGMAADATPVVAAGDWLWARMVGGLSRGDLGIEDAAAVLVALAKSGFAFRSDRPALVDHVLQLIFDEQGDDGGWESPELTGLVLEALGRFGIDAGEPVVADAIHFLGGTHDTLTNLRSICQVLSGLRAVRRDSTCPIMRQAVALLKRTQHAGGGWADGVGPAVAPTAWALLALMAARDANSPEVDAGVNWLLDAAPTTFEPTAFSLMALAQFERHAVGWTCRM
jgi:squalene-hopene/tetraprenyl-beta-curcumene cyclase